jgi:hypothetical protein
MFAHQVGCQSMGRRVAFTLKQKFHPKSKLGSRERKAFHDHNGLALFASYHSKGVIGLCQTLSNRVLALKFSYLFNWFY